MSDRPSTPAIPVMPGAVALGWGTVELDRAVAELTALVAGPFVDAPASELLGASCRRARAATGDGALWIVVLEPSTEGRLAASLARHGEGWLATWVAVPPEPPPAAWSAIRPGPLGPERLAVGGPMWDPHVLRLVGDTIEP